MNEAVLPAGTDSNVTLSAYREQMVRIWFVAAAIGHFIFVAYILATFYPPVAQHGVSALAGMHLPSGFREGDTLGNLAALSHVLIAALVIGGGPLQLLPIIRRRYPAFHRRLGRAYLVAATISALGGLYMVWTRGTVGDIVSHLTISLDAVLILAFAGFTIYHAVGRRIAVHQRWAMRLFMVASAVWFFRVGLMGWVALTGGAGIDFESFTGPFLYALGFAQYLLPLAMLEWHFRCKAGVSSGEQLAFSGVLALLTLYMCLGIFTATVGMWIPRM